MGEAVLARLYRAAPADGRRHLFAGGGKHLARHARNRSGDGRHLLKAQDYIDPSGTTPGQFVNYKLADGSALNGQGAVIWNATDTSSYYFNVSDRTRFPTLMERFSTRFGQAASNPDLKAERAAN